MFWTSSQVIGRVALSWADSGRATRAAMRSTARRGRAGRAVMEVCWRRRRGDIGPGAEVGSAGAAHNVALRADAPAFAGRRRTFQYLSSRGSPSPRSGGGGPKDLHVGPTGKALGG